MKLSLVIPCYNEAKNLPLLVERCQHVVTEPNIEIVLVDNGSTDETPSVLADILADETQIRSVRVPVNEGYGHGIMFGLKAATGDVLGWTHADMQTDPKDALKGFQFFQEASSPENIFVKGRRGKRPFGDLFFTYGMSIIETIIMRTVLHDVNAQPTLFHRNLFEDLHNPPSDFMLDLYTYVRAKRRGCVVRRFPVTFAERAFGASHWNINLASKFKFARRTLAYSLSGQI